MHARWPWAGYFLRLNPISENSPIEQVVDLSLFMALALCHVDDLTYFESKHGTLLRHNGDQLCKILAEFQGRAAELGTAIGLPDWTIRQRDDPITSAVVSFFTADQSLHHPKPKNRKRK